MTELTKKIFHSSEPHIIKAKNTKSAIDNRLRNLGILLTLFGSYIGLHVFNVVHPVFPWFVPMAVAIMAGSAVSLYWPVTKLQVSKVAPDKILVFQRVCAYCGAQSQLDVGTLAKFCESCGKSLTPVVDRPQETAPMVTGPASSRSPL